MDNHETTILSTLTGAGLAVVNNLTGIFNEPLFISHLQDDVMKSLVVGFAGALGGLAAKALYSVTTKKFRAWTHQK